MFVGDSAPTYECSGFQLGLGCQIFLHGKSDTLGEEVGCGDSKCSGNRSDDETDGFWMGPHHMLARHVGDINAVVEKSIDVKRPGKNG